MFGLFSKKSHDVPPKVQAWSGAALAPSETVTLIGDIHGMDALLVKLLDALPDDAGQLVFMGDLVDRGDQSAKVVAQVQSLTDDGALCIMGNHERMLLNFLESPQREGGRFLRYGGLQTLMSYGITGVTTQSQGDVLDRTAEALAAAMGDQRAWMEALPARLTFGNLEVIHAGANPYMPLDAQKNGAFVWGHDDFFKSPRADETWVAVGHTIMDRPYIHDGRIGIDTGSYATGNLSAITIKPDGTTQITSTLGITEATQSLPRSVSSR